jgi:hypothetical protein
MRYVHDRGIIKRSAIRVGVISAVFVLAAQAVTGVLNTRVAQAVSPTETVVLPSNFANTATTWTFHDDTANPFVAATPTHNSQHETVMKPGSTESTDNGAVKLQGAASGAKWNLASLQYSGTKLSDITSLGFDLRTDSPGKAYINLDIDFNDPSLSGYQGRLVYAPTGVIADVWDSHEAVASDGLWQWSNIITGAATEWPDTDSTEARTWSDLTTAFPDATITSIDNQSFGSLYLRSDGTSTTYYDKVFLATNTDAQVYNFELPKPDAPTLVSPADGAIVQGTSLTNVWSSVPGADHYVYESYSDEAATSVLSTQNVAGTNKTATNVADSTFWWRVKAVDSEGVESNWSETWKVTVDNTAPVWLPGPYHLWPNNNAEVEEGSEIIMQWVDATDANEGIKYFYQVSNSSNVLSIGGEFATPIWTFGPLSESQLDSTGTAVGEYYWHVRACDAANNCTPWTDPWRGSVVEADVSESPGAPLLEDDVEGDEQGAQLQRAPAAGNFPLQFAAAGVGPGPAGAPQDDEGADASDGEQGQVLGFSDDSSSQQGSSPSESTEGSSSAARFVIPAAVAGGGSLWWLIAAMLRRRSDY